MYDEKRMEVRIRREIALLLCPEGCILVWNDIEVIRFREKWVSWKQIDDPLPYCMIFTPAGCILVLDEKPHP